jgi:hypothetical protein
MSKSLIKSNLAERSSTRALLAVSLCATMAAFGCTTDRTLGNGDPVVTPGSRTSPTGGTSAGSESEAIPPPMMSSFSNGSVPVRNFDGRLSADEAAAIMAEQQPRVRVLGPVSPGPRPSYGASQMMLAQQQAGGQTSVNSTLYSGPTEVITSGAGEPVAGVDTSGVVVGTDGSAAAPVIAGSSVTTGTATTAAAGTNVTNAAGPVIAPTGTAITPTSSAVSNPAAFASVRTLSPTAASVVNPPASISGSPAVATTSSSRTNTTGRTTTTLNPTVSSSSVSPATSVGVANPVRVMNTNGRVTITNGGTTRATTTGTTRQQ